MAPTASKKKSAKSNKAVKPLQEEQTIMVTKEGLKTLQEELKQLKEVRRKELATRLKEAISYGDLSENSEYEEAKNEQAFVEGRILELENMIRMARVVDEAHHSKQVVEIGSKVVIALSSKGSEKMSLTIVGATEADPFNQKISNESPMGMALMGKKVGDTAIVDAPIGKTSYEILDLA